MNEKKWKIFKIKDLFETNGEQVLTGAYINKNELVEGNIPRITVRDTNNGVDSFCMSNNQNFRVFENFISVSFLGSVFYHPYKASIDMKVHALLLKKHRLTKNLAYYLIALIRENTHNYSYGNQLSSKDLSNLKLMLPINDNEEPDYDYMEKCISELADEGLECYVKYAAVQKKEITMKEIPELNQKKWYAFNISDIFDTIQRGKRLKKMDHIDGKVPYVSSTMNNNGVDGFISNDNGKKFKNCLTIANSGSVGATFFHQYEFIGSDHITSLKNNKFNKFIYLFLTIVVSKIGEKYSFNREINDFRISNEKIYLPIDDSKQPDYKYMEQYIKNIMYEQYSKYLDFLED